ncbi:MULTISPECIES: hypothetical protein [unclassified Pseudomonas]|nr:hypothetical protein [Pseudomonas sp. MWU12-2020]
MTDSPETARLKASDRPARQCDGTAVTLFEQIIVNNRDECITLFK